MSGVKIQINSLEALERLIGGDTQLEIDLRNSIVQEFSKKYLKAVAAELAETLVEPYKKQVQDELRYMLGIPAKFPANVAEQPDRTDADQTDWQDHDQGNLRKRGY